MQRRKFIRNTFIAGGLSLVFPKLILGETAKTNLKSSDSSVLKPEPSKWLNDTITIAWIGHSTVLINFYGKIIITDPILFEKVGVYFWGTTFGQSRYSPPAIEPEEMPKPDIVLLSHGHMDHTDYKSLKFLTEKYPKQIDCITAYNTSDISDNLEWKSIKELDWNEGSVVQDVSITALRVKHFGWRYPWEKDRSRGFMKDGRSFNAYLIEKNGKRILFGGDTAYQNYFEQGISGSVDIAIMPIGAYNPWKLNHCNPEEAFQMALGVGSKYFIPIHCNTFKQGLEPPGEPIKLAIESSAKFGIEMGIKELGGTFSPSRQQT